MPKLLPWEQLQEDVQRALIIIEDSAKISIGSGSVKGNGDVQSPTFMAECKLRSTDGFTINRSVYKKVCCEAALLGKIPLLVNRNKRNETMVTLSLKDFVTAMRTF
jgi:hypothetical protein